MAIIFLDEFEDPPETEGNAPTLWPIYNGMTFQNREVDNVRAHLGSLSLWLKSKASGHGFCEASQAFGTERIRIWVYFEDTTTDFRMITSKTAVGYTSANFMAYLYAATDGKIYYYDTGANDTGQTYSTGWHYFDIVHDWGADTFDAWYDGTQIVTGGSFFSNQTGASGVGVAFFIPEGADNEMWVDDVQIGESAPFSLSPSRAGPTAGGVPI